MVKKQALLWFYILVILFIRCCSHYIVPFITPKFDYFFDIMFLGLVSFLLAHIFYVFAFGWHPFKSRMMLRSIIVAGLSY